MDKKKIGNSIENEVRRREYEDISNISGGITDEEFADEFLAYPASPGDPDASFQFNFIGAELEKINQAKNVKDELRE